VNLSTVHEYSAAGFSIRYVTLVFLLIKHSSVLGFYALLLKLNRRLKLVNVILSF
jgi:hypothetical protein